jgi:hypothetical protein
MTVHEFNFLFHYSEQENVILTFLVKLHTYSEFFFNKQLSVSKLSKKPYCTTLKFGHMDQLYNNLTPDHG